MSEIIHVTDASFQEEVIRSSQPVLVDFWAPWCGPCRMIAPILEELAQEYGGKIKIAKINVDENQQTAFQYGIMSIPTLGLFLQGHLVERTIGFMPKADLIRVINQAFRLAS